MEQTSKVLPPFNGAEQCPKCGYDDLGTYYHETDMPGSECWCQPHAKGEHIHRYCRRCQYTWMEAPLDATPKATVFWASEGSKALWEIMQSKKIQTLLTVDTFVTQTVTQKTADHPRRGIEAVEGHPLRSLTLVPEAGDFPEQVEGFGVSIVLDDSRRPGPALADKSEWWVGKRIRVTLEALPDDDIKPKAE